MGADSFQKRVASLRTQWENHPESRHQCTHELEAICSTLGGVQTMLELDNVCREIGGDYSSTAGKIFRHSG